MKKLNLKVKKNILVSVLVVLVIVFGTILISSITKEHNAKDTQALVKDNESVYLKNDDAKTEKPTEDKQLNSNPETTKKENKVVKPEPPKEKPKTNDDVTNKNKVPTYPEKEVKPQLQTPKDGETNNEGQVNFPGFGQVEDGGANKGQNVNSNGDINKQVGKMD
ncbi:DUF6550 family protein [Clostridium sp. DJ247]|uniref:DUF6550 family protein n=1 Tax=Clostridium sp. DJ247 TaxID=2726188 RepID=UPI00162A7D75|nr:DUF6550 family protein [Clostridium sp. DJ247]MBC2579387.1 hypothetical protein [Clostridium sp. DJ247]